MFLHSILLAVLLFANLHKAKENACIFILCRESDLRSLKDTLSVFERRFNAKYSYPYVILNDKEFSAEFRQEIQKVTKSEIEYGVVPANHWGYPPWIDKKKAEKCMRKMEKEGVIYGGLESYRHMCRFFSGFFFLHPLSMKYRYYWRVEPDTHLLCDVNYDVFKYMRENGKKYGFTITLHEYPSTIPTLWNTVQRFVHNYNTMHKPGDMWELISPSGLKRFISDEMFTSYNLCHFWSNFEIGDFSFFRDKKYQLFFEYLDKTGGFFYERWGDAPVHTIAVSLFLQKKEIHYFEDIGYMHPPFSHCPKPSIRKSQCDCKYTESVDVKLPACISLYQKISLFSPAPMGRS